MKLLEARIQQLTEDNDDLRRCYNLQKRELEENGHWVDNQEQLMKASQQLKEENIKMKEYLENLDDEHDVS